MLWQRKIGSVIIVKDVYTCRKCIVKDVDDYGVRWDGNKDNNYMNQVIGNEDEVSCLRKCVCGHQRNESKISVGSGIRLKEVAY